MNQEFKLKKIDEIRDHLIDEKNENEIMSKKPRNLCRVLNYTEHLLNVISTITGWVSISAFASLVGISVWITSSAIGLKICVINAGILKYNSIIKKKKKTHDNIVLLAKPQLNIIELLIPKALIDSNISCDEIVLINNGPKEFYDMKEKNQKF